MWNLSVFGHRRKDDVDSHIALSESKADLERIKQRSVEVAQVSEASRNLLRRNHFIEKLEGIMGG